MCFAFVSLQYASIKTKFAETKFFCKMRSLFISLKRGFVQLSKSIKKAIFVKGI